MAKRNKKPWPTKDVMHQIYDLHLWGGKTFDFYSGTGSHNRNITAPYLKAIIEFLISFKSPLVVCDLGCGDFNIGKHLVKYTKKYIAVDIVEDLIDRNKRLFREDNLEFLCVDIAEEELPDADCIILRQVLQHLSNAEILRITRKLSAYKYLILSEHIPVGEFIPNKDIISGQGIRLKHHSGVDLLEPPFNFKALDERILNEFVLEPNKERIVTTLYKLF